MQDEIVFRFLDEDVAARAWLLREQAPATCEAVLDGLPAAGLARHGIYSGSEVYLFLPRCSRHRASTRQRSSGPAMSAF